MDAGLDHRWEVLPGSGVRRLPFQLPPHYEMRGHTHTTAHLCLVETGTFEEMTATGCHTWGAGTARRALPGRAHHLATASTPAAGWMLDLLPGWGYTDRRFWPTDPRHPLPGAPCPLGDLPALVAPSAATSPLRLHLAIRQLLARLAFPSTPRPAWYEDVVHDLEQHYRRPLTSADLAQTAGLHRTHFARQFFRTFGCTAGEALRARRLDDAWHALRSTTASVAAIAHDAGFADQSHLTRLFQQYFHRTPGAFRRQPHRPPGDATYVQEERHGLP